jgi:fructose-bisphosphate aldolase class II
MNTTRTIYRKFFLRARKEHWAIGQFNVGSFEVLEGVMRAALAKRSPVLIGTSEGESKFLGLSQTVALVRAWEKKLKIPVLLNLDHAHTLGYIKDALLAGYDSVHFDGSSYPFEKNVRIARSVVVMAKRHGAHVEGEIEKVPGASHVIQQAPRILPEYLTDPLQAQEFVKRTKVDRIAVNIGTFHGMSSSGTPPVLSFPLLKSIASTLPLTSLVLHGASGTRSQDVKKAVKLGVTKLNVNTELRLAFHTSLIKELKRNPNEIVPYHYFVEPIKNVQREVEKKIILFGSARKL